MRRVRFLRGWTGQTMARYSTGDVAGFADEEAQIIVGAGAGVYADAASSAAVVAPHRDKMLKEPQQKKEH